MPLSTPPKSVNEFLRDEFKCANCPITEKERQQIIRAYNKETRSR